jgi:hypothetical protein
MTLVTRYNLNLPSVDFWPVDLCISPNLLSGENPTTLRSSNFGRQARSEVELGVSHEAFLSIGALA